MKEPRQCGSCSLCCKLMDVPEVKDPHRWCPHVKRGIGGNVTGGCSIYQSRPERCRTFNCFWLQEPDVPEHWYPLKSKIVINAFDDASGRGFVAFVVDPAYPNRWREEPWFSDIKTMARLGLQGISLGPHGHKKWTTFVLIKDQRIPIIGTSSLLRAS